MKTPVLKALFLALSSNRLIARQVETGFILVLLNQQHEQILQAQRGGDRVFKKLDNLAKYASSLGARQFEVQLSS